MSSNSNSNLFLITVGKLKDPGLKSIENEYLKRLSSSSIRLSIRELKAYADDPEREGEEVLKLIQTLSNNSAKSHIILLKEDGELFNSINFSKNIFNREHLKLFFVIAGAHGPSKCLISSAQQFLSLSTLTFPHQLARIIFIEQIYRAETIHQGHPYHH